MLSRSEQAALRSRLFRHLDGLVTCPAAYVLHEKGVTKKLLAESTVSLSGLAKEFRANDGYLNVALRTLCSQGWLDQQVDNEQNTVLFSVNEASETAFGLFGHYREAAGLLKISGKYHPRKFEMEPFLVLERLYRAFLDRCGMGTSDDVRTTAIQEQVLCHIEGVIVGPTLVHLGMSRMFHKYFMETRFQAEEFHKDPRAFERLLDILVGMGWFSKSGSTYEFTEKGLFFAKRASAYGVTVSYLPTLRSLDELIFGNPLCLKGKQGDAGERHVDREMNVWGSGGAHAAYFRVVDEIIIDLFNRPLEEQPKGILDMGCGNGAFLQHLFTVIETQTYRGEVLEDHPLLLIGVDYNEAALAVSRRNLIQADIWAKIIWGDIGNPDGLASDLQVKYGIDLKDLLNVRTFLDHNRIWEPPASPATEITDSTGSYAFEGKRLDNNLVLASLKQHFGKWAPYISRFGLLLIELHTVPPALVAKHLGRSAVTAYDATHGYSDQYIVEIDTFISAIRDTGLIADPAYSRKFPDSDLATISVNLFRAE